ncbi:biopolymer transporter ExbD [Roseobacter sp. HKCCA0434]|uniref:biopolymer transporter ExbD n=1 Tax=Roseobacter sp. HKCCA0434 TaxID=3079297 RepID=UPI00290593EF|nr:biopolymer transporter ExbD [Roseobacter sp. HKCCA0434]
MSAILPRRVRRRRVLSLTSLIDVIFLLLLFFMLTSTFSRFGEIELAAGGDGAQAAEAPPLFLRLRAEGLDLNGEALTLEELAAALGEAEGARTVLVALRGEVSSQRLADLLVVLAGVPGVAPVVLGSGT